jgi:hypothetical protein
MKYKVGDKVKVRDDLVVGNCYSYYAYCGDMVNFKGKTVTIKSVAYDFYRIEEDRQTSCWADGMFEDVEGDEAEIAKFRAFLKEVADYRVDGYSTQYKRLRDIIVADTIFRSNKEIDGDIEYLCNFYRTFKPTEKKKMTKAEIEDALGYKIEIVEE